MKKKWLKKGSAALLAAVMGLSLFPKMEGTLTVQAAGGAPEAAYWTDAAGLQGCNLTGNTEGSIIFGQNGGGSAQTWKIAGTDSGRSDANVILFAATPLTFGQPPVFEDNWTDNKDYDYGEGLVKVFPNHYGSSDLRNTLNGSMNLFTTDEQNKMNATTISTYDEKNTHSYTVEDFLYAPSGGLGESVIRVGSGDDVQIPLNKLSGSDFWLRSPDSNFSSDALVASPGVV